MKKFLCLMLAFVLIFCAACSSDKKSEVPEEDQRREEDGGTEKKERERDKTPAVEGKWVVKNGVSDYYVLIPDSASTTTQLAAAELVYFFNRATDVNLSIKTDSEYSESNKYISFGNTSVSGDVSVSSAELGSQGFKIKTVGDNIVVKSVGQHGLLWGAYELLTRMFGYEYYAKDVYYIDSDVKDLPLKNFDITDKPDIEVRAVADSQGYYNSEVAHRMRQFQVYDEFLLPMKHAYHNSFDYMADEDGNIDPRFLATTGLQLCYTGHGDDAVVDEMIDKAINYLKPIIAASEWSDVMFGIQDEYGWCQCKACQDCKAQYGTNSSTLILFMNKFRTKLDNYLREANVGRQINLYFFAYTDAVQPPVHKEGNDYVANDPSLVLKDGLGILFAPITNNFTQSIYSQTNEATYEQLKSFKAITNKLLVWTYACNFTDFFAPYDSITYMQDLFQAIVDNNGTYLFNQGRHSQENSSQFDALRQYLVAKLGWNVHADVEQLTDEFFDVYFGRTQAPMRKMYDELRTLMRYDYDVLGMSGAILDPSVTSEKYWPVQTLNHWLDLIDEAYALAGDDKDLHERILRESIFVRYFMLKLYILDGEDVEEMRKQFIKDAASVGIARASEQRALANVFD